MIVGQTIEMTGGAQPSLEGYRTNDFSFPNGGGGSTSALLKGNL